MQLLLHGLLAVFALLGGRLPILARGQAAPEEVDDTFCAVQAFAAAFSLSTARRTCDIVVNPPEDARTYSSRWGSDVSHALSMLGSGQAWSAGQNVAGQWLQIDLGSVMMVGGVVTQGRNLSSPYYPGYTQYVTEYTVSTATDPSSFQQQGGTYIGNYDNLASVNSVLPAPVAAQYVRIYPTAWNHHISMRAGVLGCPPPTPSPTPSPTASPTATPTTASPTLAPTPSPTAPLPELHACNKEVNPPEEARTYSSRWGNDVSHVLSMLDAAQAWSAAQNTAGEWLQIDLGSVMKVGGVVTQGRNLSSPYYPGYKQYVTEYTVSTATDPSSFQQQGGEYIANYDNMDRVGNVFPTPVLAQYLRIYPTAWKQHISMRAGALACPPTASPTVAPTQSPTASPTIANPVTSFGDPHVANIMNEKFDILREGVFTFLAIPRGSSSHQSDLHVFATVEGVGSACGGKLYVSGLSFHGQWLGEVGAINILTRITSKEPTNGVVLQVGSSPTRELSIAAFREEVPSSLAAITEFEAPRPERLNEKVTTTLIKLSLGPAVMKVRRVLQAEKVGYSASLWFSCSTLAGVQSEIGGLLGRDNHTFAASVPDECRESAGRQMSLFSMQQLRLNNEIHASAALASGAD